MILLALGIIIGFAARTVQMMVQEWRFSRALRRMQLPWDDPDQLRLL